MQATNRPTPVPNAAAAAGPAIGAPGGEFDDLAPGGVFVQSGGRFVFLDPQAATILGASSEADLLGREVIEFIHPEDRGVVRERIRRIAEVRRPLPSLRARWLRADGADFEGESTAAPCVHEGREATLVLLQDVTPRRRFIAALTEARAGAEQASRAKSAFLAAMSHEIRTPLNGVVGMVELLAHGRLSEHQAELVRTIRESAATLLDLIDDILDFSKIEAGRLVIERSPVAVAGLVEALCSSLVAVAVRQGVELSLFVSPEVPRLALADEVRLRQVLYNIIGNAIKFSAAQPGRPGRVAVRVEVEPGPAQRLSFRVADNGIGIAPGTLDRLFAPFTQAEVSTTRRFGGTGLGLAICRRLVDLMQGEIAVESAPGRGSTFTVSLPVPTAPGGESRPTSELEGVECILVGAEPARAEDLGAYLRHAGASVLFLPGQVEAALQAARLERPVIVHDVGKRPISADMVRATFAGAPRARHLIIRRGRRRAARQAFPDVVLLDGDALRRESLLRAVSLAAGRASPESVDAAHAEGLAAEGPVPPSPEEARAEGRLVLVAEDDETSRRVIAKQLALLGYASQIAGNGREALRMWREGGHGLLITDLHMPEMDGYALSEAIRREEAGLRRTPIVALTANAVRGEAGRARAAGVDEHLTKPVSLRVLRATLETWIARGRAPHGMRSAGQGRGPREGTLDVTVLEGLVGDDPATVRDFLSEFLASARGLALELHAACVANDAGRVGDIVHRLKASSRSVGARALGEACARLEEAARNRDAGAIREEATAFDAAWAAAEEAISGFLERE